MADRTDLDALLIGALYGELMPADEARLMAHLESHPADRTALAELTSTRDTVRGSGLLAIQLDPPPSSSARLMQEAARWAPSATAIGWLQRMMRGFSAHPAMAAAATFVVVAGVAGLLYAHHGGLPDATPASSSPVALDEKAGAASQPQVISETRTLTAPPSAGSAPASAATPSAGSGSYGVRLSEDRAGEPARPAEAARGEVATALAPTPTPAAPAAPAVAMPKASKKSAGIGVRTAELQPKDLDAPGTSKTAKRTRGEATDDELAADGAATGGAAVAANNSDRRQAAPKPGAAPPRDQIAAAPSYAQAPVTGNAPSAAQTPAAPRPVAGNGNAARDTDNVANAKVAASNQGSDRTLVAWAQQQHSQVIALVRANDCQGAANAAVTIYNRAPDYYAANVANDRSVKPCLAYFDRERQRRELKADKPSVSTENAAPPQAAPAQTAPAQAPTQK